LIQINPGSGDGSVFGPSSRNIHIPAISDDGKGHEGPARWNS